MTSTTFPATQLTLQELVEQVMAKALATGHSCQDASGNSKCFVFNELSVAL